MGSDFPRISGISSRAPPSANHAPKTNRSCQQNGLKYQTPSGYDGTFQSNWRAAKYSSTEAASTTLGRRNIIHKTGGKNAISTMYSGSTSILTGLNFRMRPS